MHGIKKQPCLGCNSLHTPCLPPSCRAGIENILASISVDSINDFNLARDKICYRLINQQMNKELLPTIPYRRYHDLAIVYYPMLTT